MKAQLLLAALPALFLLAFGESASGKGTGPVQLWQEWYLITQNGEAVGYFEETAERRPADKQYAITQKWVERSGSSAATGIQPDGIAETYIGSVSEEARLKPVAFFVERKSASEEKSYKTDARVKNKKIEITFKPASAAMAKSTEMATLSPDMYLSSFVPMAIARNFKEKKTAVPFTALVEDGGNMNVEIKKGTVEITGEEKKIGGDSCRGARIHFAGKAQNWWITKEGKTCLVDFPDSGVKMARSTEAEARKALGRK
jgi:hypothetical protein